MKSAKAIILTLLYVVAMLRPVAPLVEYYAQQDYIAEFLCINKEVPELDCKGMCYVQKRMEEQNKGVQGKQINLKDYPVDFLRTVTEEIFFAPKMEIAHQSFFHGGIPQTWNPPIFHPPSC